MARTLKGPDSFNFNGRLYDPLPAAKPYYLICERDTDTGLWSEQFGDFARDVAAQERRDMLDSYSHPKLKPSNLRVIKCASSLPSDCHAAIAALNRATNR